tara:strand:- start:4245 stop:5522 length:1278 start_codon:yes stop_codon:yes gene_type:complete
MPRYIVRFGAESCVRLNAKSYLDGNRHTIRVTFPNATIALFDRFVPLGDAHLPNGLLIQVALDAQDIETAIQSAGSFAVSVLNIVSCVACASIDRPFVLSAYDASQGIKDRDFVGVTYDRTTPHSTCRPEDPELSEFIGKYDQFRSNSDIPQDHKNRVERSIDAYRRALADNDDPLTDFIVLWSAIEGLDCVYRKTFPTRQSQFKDGMRDLFARLNEPGSFDTLEGLRNEIAHGNLDLDAANQMAIGNLELVRKALLLAVMWIVKCDDGTRDNTLAKLAYKGTFVTRLRLQAKIRCQPGDIKVLEGHPQIEAVLNGVQVTPKGETANITPDWRFNHSNIESYNLVSVELHGDPGANARVNDVGVTLIPNGSSSHSPTDATSESFEKGNVVQATETSKKVDVGHRSESFWGTLWKKIKECWICITG